MSGEPAKGDDRRALGLVSLVALGVNGIVGVGIFFTPATLARHAPGSASIAVVALTALALAPVAVAFSKLGGRFDSDGGPVVYARAAFGELASFATGWVSYLSAVASTAAVFSGFAHATAPSLGLEGHASEAAYASALCVALGLVCSSGLSLSARVWTGLTALKLAPLLLLSALSLTSAAPAATQPPGPSHLLEAGLAATFIFQGFEIVPVVAGQARAGATRVPVAVLGSLAISALLYVLLQRACVRSVEGLASAPAPLAQAGLSLGGPAIERLMVAGTSVSSLGICFGMVAMTPRYLSSLAEQASIWPSMTATRRDVPQRALLVTCVLVCTLLALGKLSELFALSSVAVLAQYAVTALALVRLSLRRERGLSPIDAWPALPSLLIAVVLSAGAPRELLVGAACLAVGLVLRTVATRKAR